MFVDSFPPRCVCSWAMVERLIAKQSRQQSAFLPFVLSGGLMLGKGKGLLARPNLWHRRVGQKSMRSLIEWMDNHTKLLCFSYVK